MFIEPMQGITPVSSFFEQDEKKARGAASPFKELFTNVLNDVVSSEEELAKNEYLLSIGEIDDAHTVPVSAAAAQLSVDLMVSLRNKAVESYNEIMRISL